MNPVNIRAQGLEQNMSRAIEMELRGTLDGEVAFDDYSRFLFSRDASMYSIMPLGVIFPRHAEDVAHVVQVANQFSVSLLARGAGTSLSGQAVGAGLVMDLSRHMNRILEIDSDSHLARVQPGVVQDDLNRRARSSHLMFGPDTSTSNRATIGGMIGNNSGGSGSVRYGMTNDHVRSLDVILADGSQASLGPVSQLECERRGGGVGLEAQLYRDLPVLLRRYDSAIRNDFPPYWRRSGGYALDRLMSGPEFNLSSLVVGSEGTLAVVTEAVVDLVRRPKESVFAVGHFASVSGAIAATQDALSLDPVGVELIDRMILNLARERPNFSELVSILDGDPGALLFVTFASEEIGDAGARLDRLARLWKQNGHGYHILRAQSAAQQEQLLNLRKASLGLLMAASTGTRRPLAFVEDTAVDPVHLVEYTSRFSALLDRYGLKAGFYGHCSVGCLHIRPYIDLSDPTQVQVMRAVAEEVKELVGEFGGVNSSEHGDGLARSEFNSAVFGPDLYKAMRELKAAFDPNNLLNPGKVVDAPLMTENLRDQDGTRVRVLDTVLSFDGFGGMHAAADRCMNIGLCRKSAPGTMCPSYIATRREEDSTRGRANALVRALSDDEPGTALADDRLHEILDLCLMCKACKSECPLGVDIASLKSEALYHRHAIHGVPIRTRVIGAIRSLYRIGSKVPRLTNALLRARLVRYLVDRFLNISAQRPLPTFSLVSLSRWWDDRGPPTQPVSQGTVVVLADTFTAFTEPEIGRAAVELLEHAGWHVVLETAGCCGRAEIAKGLLAEARVKALSLAQSLATVSDPTAPIVGWEPSCLLTLREEHLALLPDDPTVRAMARRVRLLEELLVEGIDEGRLVLDEAAWPARRRILFQAHCHQTAEGATAASVSLLQRIPGAQVEEIDAGCCGMAGSFGVESEHYDVSMQIGEDRLFPAVRAAGEDTIVAATGASCRQQIQHGTHRRSWHPVELIWECIQK